MARTVKLSVYYDFDTLPHVFTRYWVIVRELWAMGYDVVSEVVPVTGRSFVVLHNYNLIVPVSSSGPVDSPSGHCHIDWRPEPVKQCCA